MVILHARVEGRTPQRPWKSSVAGGDVLVRAVLGRAEGSQLW